MCLTHYIRKAIYGAKILRPKKQGAWLHTREAQTYRKERDALMAFFSTRLRSVREGSVEPVATFAESYAVLDELWNFAGLNRRQPSPERIARFISFISRQDYIARHGWHYRGWNGDLANTNWSKRKEAQNDSSRMEDDQVVQEPGIRRPNEAGLWEGDADRAGVEAGPDPLDDWDAPSGDERLPNGGA